MLVNFPSKDGKDAAYPLTVTKKLSREFSMTESHILGALIKLDEFPLNPQKRTLSETIPGSLWSTDVENHKPRGVHE